MTPEERFAFWLLRLYKTPYTWGGESFDGADCSGAVCLALYAATGFLIRTTADDLYKRVFNVAGATTGIRAAFFIAEGDRTKDGVLIRKGTAVHCAGLLDSGVVLNSSFPKARVRRLDDVKAWFEKDWCRYEVRGLGMAALEKLSRDGTRYGVDEDVWKFFEA
jgi:murein DD-endopeptidase